MRYIGEEVDYMGGRPDEMRHTGTLELTTTWEDRIFYIKRDGCHTSR